MPESTCSLRKERRERARENVRDGERSKMVISILGWVVVGASLKAKRRAHKEANTRAVLAVYATP
jgi:hypothetical protein